jgi:hypothetical protein
MLTNITSSETIHILWQVRNRTRWFPGHPVGLQGTVKNLPDNGLLFSFF